MGGLYDEGTSQLLSTQIQNEKTGSHLTPTALSKAWCEDEKGTPSQNDADQLMEEL